MLLPHRPDRTRHGKHNRSAFGQTRECLLNGEVIAAGGGIQHFVEQFFTGACERSKFTGTRIGEADIDPPMLLTNRGEEAIEVARLGHVRLYGESFLAQGLCRSYQWSGLRPVTTTFAPSRSNS